MEPRVIQQGAEAIISLKDNQITKNRISKSYRIPELDNKLRKSRTKSEAKIINKLAEIIPVPKIIHIDKQNNQIIMQYIQGKKLSENLEKLNYKEIAKQIAENITKIHNLDIIHGDLTTSNMIYVKKDIKNSDNNKKTSVIHNELKNNLNINKKINKFKSYFIDFGLGFHSHKIEDKAVDLHLLKQALEAKHHTISDVCFKIILKNYKPEKHKQIIERIKAIEKRGRYKGH